MHKDFIYVPESNLYLNINHIVDMRLQSNYILVEMTSYRNDWENTIYKFPIEYLKYFEKIIGKGNDNDTN